mgnify:CR=1 FL=1
MHLNNDRTEKKTNTTELIKALTYSFSNHVMNGCIKNHPSVFLKGQPGVGKSQAVYHIAENLKQNLNQEVHVIDVRLLMFNPVDLRGIPVADHKNQVAVWLRPQILLLDVDPKVINILFLDELTSAPMSVQAAAYQIALERRIGEHFLPDNTFIIAAGNREEDNAVTYTMPSALKNRFMHFEVTNNVNEWLLWAINQNIHPDVISFIETNPQYFMSNSMETSSNIIITPRTWEMLSSMLFSLGADLTYKEYFTASLIGEELASEFVSEAKDFSLSDLMKGEIKIHKQNLSMVQRIVDLLDEGIHLFVSDEKSLNHIYQVLCDIPLDYAIKVFKAIVKHPDTTKEMNKLPFYQKFITKLENSDA